MWLWFEHNIGEKRYDETCSGKKNLSNRTIHSRVIQLVANQIWMKQSGTMELALQVLYSRIRVVEHLLNLNVV